ncbi:MAG TPA: NAD-dependent epimerase/dehydratase family protein, partial [Clostridia bacterium]|nr:NAD-dependent epimerase/dehydratase family protein [Clostridia bacterium]
MKILITGGAGYIGSTVASALEDSGHTPIILDSLISGCRYFTKNRIFYEGDIADSKLIKKIFSEHPDISHVIHCAALIVVPDSVKDPAGYYTENVCKSLSLFKSLLNIGCKNIIFSSSASIYDETKDFMVSESSPLNPRSPYARTKYMMEAILSDFCSAYSMKGIA